MPFSLKKILHVWCLLLWLSYLLLQNTLTAPNTFNYDTDTCLVQTLGCLALLSVLRRGTLGATQYVNTMRKIGKYHVKN